MSDERTTLSGKARRAAPRLRMHARVAERRMEFEALFVRQGPKCLPFRHDWLYYGLFACCKVCRKCGVTRGVPTRFPPTRFSGSTEEASDGR